MPIAELKLRVERSWMSDRCWRATKDFQLTANVDLKDGGLPIEVEVDFLIPRGSSRKRNRPKLVQGFRALEIDASKGVFSSPVEMELPGKTILGAENTVKLLVASAVDFLFMKAGASRRGSAARRRADSAREVLECERIRAATGRSVSCRDRRRSAGDAGAKGV